MSIKKSLKFVEKNYEDYRKKNKTRKNKDIAVILNELKESIEKSNILSKFPEIKIHASGGSGNYVKKPIIYFLDKRLTTKATSGVYVALFIGTEVPSQTYIAITQAVKPIKDIEFPNEKKELEEEMLLKAEEISKGFCLGLQPMEFSLAHNRKLMSSKLNAAEKSLRNVNDTDFIKYLGCLLTAYRDYVDDFVYEEEGEVVEDACYRSILGRRGQPKFRRELIQHYKECVVTGCKDSAVLEAAHIIAHSQKVNYSMDNGLLLRADIHTLFDLNLLSVDGSGFVHVDKSLINSKEYKKFNGKKVKVNLSKAAKSNLKSRYAAFKITV